MAKQARVGQKLDFGRPNVADAMSTRLRPRTESGLAVTEVYALRESGPDSGLTADQKANRDRLAELLEAQIRPLLPHETGCADLTH